MGNGSYSRIDEQRQQQRRGGNILSKRYALFREKRPPPPPPPERERERERERDFLSEDTPADTPVIE